jgi:hypothetical protein
MCALLAALLLACCSCASENDPVPYEDGTHTHIYGHWYEVREATPDEDGEQVRYCKICHLPQTDTVEYSEP